MKIYPTNVDQAADRATVRTEVKRDNGDQRAVNYSMRKTRQGWKAVDVNIDGISYVKSYHDDFDAQIDQQGLDAVISRLEKGEKPGEISKTMPREEALMSRCWLVRGLGRRTGRFGSGGVRDRCRGEMVVRTCAAL